jgi:type II secretory pathway pseudopilin PulG
VIGLPATIRRSGARGFTLVAIAIGIAVMTILIAAVAPSLATIMRREREEELIFRGRQYARAIPIFQKRFGRYPNSLKELYENRPRAIRKLWKDPMCRCDDWHLLILGSPDAIPFRLGTGGQPGTGLPPPRPTPTPGPFGAPAEGTTGPIVGVRSKVHKEALREWRGKKFYDEWGFLAGDAEDTRPTLIPPGGNAAPPPPGQPPPPPPRRS